ncbi:hypothetical protein V6N13_069240 [Hibiscus sabdariffa]
MMMKSYKLVEESKGDQERSEMNVQEDVEFEEEHEKGTLMEYCHDTEYYDSDDHGHITKCSLEEEDDEYCAKMRSMFSVYNPNHENPEFCIGMLFKDGKEFKDAIRKYSKLSRRELKIIRNEPKRIRVKCLASAKCPWRIFASYSRATRCIQGLEIAINDVLPRVEHRNCARHVFVNWIGRKKLKSYEFDFWEIVKASIEREWEDKFEALTQKDELVAKDLKSKSPKHWTKAFFGCHSKCDMVDDNICEAFNSSILEARYKSIITMLGEIRVKLMTRIVEKRKFCKSWKQNYGPLVKRKFDQNKKDSIEWNMVWNGDNGCEVKKGRKQYIVKLQDRICRCRSWQLTGLPCPHACCAIWHMGGDPDDYLDQCYHKNTYMKAYAYALHPINGAHDWIKSGIESILPPIEKKMSGRPKKNRRKAKDEPKKKAWTT